MLTFIQLISSVLSIALVNVCVCRCVCVCVCVCVCLVLGPAVELCTCKILRTREPKATLGPMRPRFCSAPVRIRPCLQPVALQWPEEDGRGALRGGRGGVGGFGGEVSAVE